MSRRRYHDQRIVNVPIEDIKLIPNPRIHPEKEIEELIKSIEIYGMINEVGISKADGTLLLGYARYEAHKRLGRKTIPARLLDIDPEEYHALIIADNRISDLASWDFEMLIKQIDTDLGGDIETHFIAYTPDEIEQLRHWQEESQASLDVEDLVSKRQLRAETGPEVVEIVVTLPLSVWEKRRNEIDGELAAMALRYDGLRYTPPKVKIARSK